MLEPTPLPEHPKHVEAWQEYERQRYASAFALDHDVQRTVFGEAWPDASGGMYRSTPAGWHLVAYSDKAGSRYINGVIPHYSTDMSAAFLVVERMRKQGWYVTLDEWPWGRRHEESWRVEFAFRNELGGYAKEQSFATSPAHAICRAALAALAPTTGREGRGDA